MIFKVGDKVELITNLKHPSEHANWAERQELNLNTIYKVYSLDGDWIGIFHNNFIFYHPPQKFKLVKTTINHYPPWF